MLTSRNPDWGVVAEFEMPLTESVWGQMLHGGSSFQVGPEGAIDNEEALNPPDLHKYTGTKSEIPDDRFAPSSLLVPPKQ
jgi:hypothetical protein